MIYQKEKEIKDLDDKLTDYDNKDLNEAVEKLKEANKSNNVEDIKSAMDNLNSVWNEKASHLYQESKQTTQSSDQGDVSEDTENKNTDIQDAEVIEED